MAASDTESVYDNMTRLRMKMMQKKLAQEKEKLQRPESSSSDSHVKLQKALLRRQELLNRLRQEQAQEDPRARSTSPRRRYNLSPLPPPPSRRSLPDLSRLYRLNVHNKDTSGAMGPANYVIEHQFRPPEHVTQNTYTLPPIYQAPVVSSPPPQITTIQSPRPAVVQQIPSVTYLETTGANTKSSPFNKADFMDMMMMQNVQMHHMAMQQIMLHQLPGRDSGWSMPAPQVPLTPVIQPPVMSAAPALSYASAPPPAPVVHHFQSLPPLEPRAPPPNARVYNSNPTFYDDGTNYFTYH